MNILKEYELYKEKCKQKKLEPFSYKKWLRIKAHDKIVASCKKCRKGI